MRLFIEAAISKSRAVSNHVHPLPLRTCDEVVVGQIQRRGGVESAVSQRYCQVPRYHMYTFLRLFSAVLADDSRGKTIISTTNSHPSIVE